MKCNFILIIIFLLACSPLVGQSTRIPDIDLSISKRKTTLAAFFKEVENQTTLSFFYTNETFDVDRTIIFEYDRAFKTLNDYLDFISEKFGVEFKIINNTIGVQKKIKGSQFNIRSDSSRHIPIQITGQITDEDGIPLSTATVVMENNSTGVTTDSEGRFVLENSEPTMLTISHLGFLEQTFFVSTPRHLDVKMILDDHPLDEVIVIGYGSVTKKDLNGAISSVKAEDLQLYPSFDGIELIQGLLAGVEVKSVNGEPGNIPEINIRGITSIGASNAPIVVVDGFVGGLLPPPGDIESIEILKDAASTAVYGSRGANGVVIITTKRGEIGTPVVQLDASYSVKSPLGTYELLDANEYAAYIKEINPSYLSGGQNTDWQDEIYQSGGILNTHLSISGASQYLNYYVSATHFRERGIVVNSSYEGLSLISNLKVRISSNIDFSTNVIIGGSKKEGIISEEPTGGSLDAGVLSTSVLFDPDLGIFDENGNYTVSRTGDAYNNPFSIATENINETNSELAQANLKAEVRLVKGLSLITSLGINTSNSIAGRYIPKTLNAGAAVDGSASVETIDRRNLLTESYFTYSLKRPKANLTFVGGYSYQNQVDQNYFVKSTGFTTDLYSYNNLDAGINPLPPTSSIAETEIVSLFSRLNFGLLSKYLASINLRYDGASPLSENNKYALFPSIALAWKMKKEDFLMGVSIINDLKLRLSIGLTGNQSIPPYTTTAAFTNVLYVENGVIASALSPLRLGNPELIWEKNLQYNTGVDLNIFKNNLTLSLDFYHTTTSNLLFEVPLPGYSGFLTQLSNSGQMINKGVELTLSSYQKIGAVNWHANFNISANRSKIGKLPNDNSILLAQGPQHFTSLGTSSILQEGQPIGMFYGYQFDGIYQIGEKTLEGAGFEQSAGGEKFKDIDGDGNLDDQDRTIIGNPNPDFIWGFNTKLTWKNVDLGILVQSSVGNDIYSLTLLELNGLSGRNNATKEALERWTPDNPSNKTPRAVAGRPLRSSDRFVFDGSYVRIKNLALGYTFAQSLSEKIHFKKLRIYASGQNLFTFTKYPGIDPEVNYQSSNTNRGVDYGTYPNSKSITFGVNCTF